MQQQHKPHLLRGLNARHIRFIALGSAIGTGLFYGSASAIKAAGPAVPPTEIYAGGSTFSLHGALPVFSLPYPLGRLVPPCAW